MASLLDLQNKLKDLFNQAGNYTAQQAGNVRQFVQNPHAQDFIPNFKPQDQSVRKTVPLPQSVLHSLMPYQNAISGAQKGVENVAQGIVNLPRNLFGGAVNETLNTAHDTARILAPSLPLQHAPQTVPQYQDLKSGIGKLGYQIAQAAAPNRMSPQMKTKMSPVEALGNVGQAAAPFAPFTSGIGAIAPSIESGAIANQGSKSLLSAVGKGAAEAFTKWGFPTGFLDGLSKSRDAKTVQDQVIRAAREGVITGTQFAVLGGTMAGGKYLYDLTKAKAMKDYFATEHDSTGYPIKQKFTNPQGGIDFQATVGGQNTKQLLDKLYSQGKLSSEETTQLMQDPGIKAAYDKLIMKEPSLQPMLEKGIQEGDTRGLLSVIKSNMDDATKSMVGDINRADMIAAGTDTFRNKIVAAEPTAQESLLRYKTGDPSVPGTLLPKNMAEAQQGFIRIGGDGVGQSGKDLTPEDYLTQKASQLGSQALNDGELSVLGKNPLIVKLTAALKEAQPLRNQQEQLYTEARGQKLAKLMAARNKMGGEQGYFKELGALKGDLPKVQYESVRKQFTQENVDELFNIIKRDKNLGEWDKINAQVGLAKILGKEGGGVPTNGEIEKLNTVFGGDFTKTLLSKRSTFQKLGDLGMQLYNLPRSFMAGVGDFSGTLMQNSLFAYRHPIMTAKNFGSEVRMFGSEHYFQASQQEIAHRPTYDLMRKAGVELTDVGPNVANREEQFMSNLAEKTPGIGKIIHATGRAYTGFLNRMRADVFDSVLNSYKESGGGVNDPAFLKSLGEFINVGTGRGNLGQLERVAPVLGQGLFSARKLTATFQTLNPMFYVGAHPAIRKEALRTMLSFFAGATALTQLSKLAGATVGEDPTNTDFGKVKFGNTRFSFYGPYQQLAVLFARLTTGYATSSTTGKKMLLGDPSNPYAPNRFDLLTRYFESKEHPTLSLVTAALRGQNNIGQPFNAPAEVLNRFIPMMLSDGYDLYKEHGPVGLLGIFPAILGISTQTYGSQIPTIKTSAAGKASVKLQPVPGLAEDVVNKVTGNQVSNIPKDQWQGYIDAKNNEFQQTNLTQEAKQALTTGEIPSGTKGLEKATFEINGTPYEGFTAGKNFVYLDENGDQKSTTLAQIEKNQIQYKKGIFEAQYSLSADRLKRAGDTAGWHDLTQTYVDYLKEYQKTLDPKKDAKETLSVQNKIEDLEASLNKGGKKPAKVTFPKAPTIKIRGGTIRKTKLPKISLSLPGVKVKTSASKNTNLPLPKASFSYRIKRNELQGLQPGIKIA